MNCFINHIGLTNCTTGVYDVPASGIYLNSLPGITIENVDKVASNDQITYLGLWDDVQEFALAQFRLDVMNEIKKCYKINSDCDYDTLICANIDDLTLAWKYLLGASLMIFRLNSDRLNRWTTIGREQAQGLLDQYQGWYIAALQQGVLLMDTSECCLTCEPNPAVVVWLP